MYIGHSFADMDGDGEKSLEDGYLENELSRTAQNEESEKDTSPVSNQMVKTEGPKRRCTD